MIHQSFDVAYCAVLNLPICFNPSHEFVKVLNFHFFQISVFRNLTSGFEISFLRFKNSASKTLSFLFSVTNLQVFGFSGLNEWRKPLVGCLFTAALITSSVRVDNFFHLSSLTIYQTISRHACCVQYTREWNWGSCCNAL